MARQFKEMALAAVVQIMKITDDKDGAAGEYKAPGFFQYLSEAKAVGLRAEQFAAKFLQAVNILQHRMMTAASFDIGLLLSAKYQAPARSLAARPAQARAAEISQATTDLSLWLPKNIELRRSLITRIGRSRSSLKILVWGVWVRAVTRQSILRTSSPG